MLYNIKENLKKSDTSSEVNNNLGLTNTQGQAIISDDLSVKAKEAFIEFERSQKNKNVNGASASNHLNNFENNPNTEISLALNEYELKQKNEKFFKNPSKEQAENINNSKMVMFVMKNSGGLIKNNNQANYVLLFCVLLFLGTSLYLFFGNKVKKEGNKIPIEVLEQMETLN